MEVFPFFELFHCWPVYGRHHSIFSLPSTLRCVDITRHGTRAVKSTSHAVWLSLNLQWFQWMWFCGFVVQREGRMVKSCVGNNDWLLWYLICGTLSMDQRGSSFHSRNGLRLLTGWIFSYFEWGFINHEGILFCFYASSFFREVNSGEGWAQKAPVLWSVM